jgi:hypothetical protein
MDYSASRPQHNLDPTLSLQPASRPQTGGKSLGGLLLQKKGVQKSRSAKSFIRQPKRRVNVSHKTPIYKPKTACKPGPGGVEREKRRWRLS